MTRGRSENRHNHSKVRDRSKKKMRRQWFGGGNNKTSDDFEKFYPKNVGLNIGCRCDFCMSSKKREWKPSIHEEME